MPPGYRKIRIFLSSPGDVPAERVQMRGVVEDLNLIANALAPEKKIILELMTWEHNVAPAFAAGGPQQVVSDQIGPYEIYIGIMWQRFGTPTPQCGSGTEAEFNDAYASWQKTGTPDLMFYFCQAPVPPGKIDARQLVKVHEFRDKLHDLALLSEYGSHEEFGDIVRRQLAIKLGHILSDSGAVMDAAKKSSQAAPAGGASVEQDLMALAEQYVKLRRAMSAGDERTRQQEVIFTRMRTLAFSAYPLLDKLKQSVPADEGKDGRAGERLAAVALLQTFPDPESLNWLADRLGQERPFLGYHAAVALLVAARTLDVQHLHRLRAAVRRAVEALRLKGLYTDRRKTLKEADQIASQRLKLSAEESGREA